jgi:hypothetical protein
MLNAPPGGVVDEGDGALGELLWHAVNDTAAMSAALKRENRKYIVSGAPDKRALKQCPSQRSTVFEVSPGERPGAPSPRR